jgi:aminoglycoside phosphotransferase
MSEPAKSQEAINVTKEEVDVEINDLPPKLPKFSYLDAIVGKEIHNFWGNRVLEQTSSKGQLLALKVSSPDGLDRSQGDMMNYAATHGVLTPKVFGTYDIFTTKPIARVMVSERVAGVPLVDVWRDISQHEQTSIKEQLRVQIQHMRTLTQPFIGRVNQQPTRNLYDTTFTRYCGPFENEKLFDDWCLNRLYGGVFQKKKWQRILEKQRRTSSGKFVLTHGDLSPRNILVQGSTITGIIDWELSGFFPEHVEYATAIGLNSGMEKWWIPVLKDVLEPCSKDTIKFTGLIEERVGSY